MFRLAEYAQHVDSWYIEHEDIWYLFMAVWAYPRFVRWRAMSTLALLIPTHTFQNEMYFKKYLASTEKLADVWRVSGNEDERWAAGKFATALRQRQDVISWKNACNQSRWESK